MKYKTKPFAHQHTALKRALKQGYIGLLWEPGVAKSKVIVDWSAVLHHRGQLNRVLILAPLSVVGVWKDEYEIHCPTRYNFYTLDRKGLHRWGRKKKGALTVLCCNYDIAWRRDDELLRFGPDMVVVDESHYIKRPSTRRSRFCYRKGIATAPYRAILTGTVTPKSFLDLYGQWKFLNPRAFGTDKAAFVARYIIYGGFMKHQVKGYQNVSELKAKVKADASVRRKDQTLDLPPELYQKVPIELEDHAYRMYTKLAEELFLEIKGEVVDIKNAAVKIMRLHQLCGGFLKTEEGNLHQVSKAKLMATAELLEAQFEADQRVVMFCRFLAEIDAIQKLSVLKHVPLYVVRGATKPKDRDTYRKEFQKREGPSLFLAQIQTGGLGITLNKSQEAIFYSMTYQLDHYIQAQGRLHRAGQKGQHVRYQHLLARDTVDYDIYNALRLKKDILAVIMGKPSLLTKRLKLS